MDKGIPIFDLLYQNLGKQKEIEKSTKELQLLLEHVDKKIKYNTENGLSIDKLMEYRNKVNNSLNVSVADNISHDIATYVKIQLLSNKKLKDEKTDKDKENLINCRNEVLSLVDENTRNMLIKRFEQLDK